MSENNQDQPPTRPTGTNLRSAARAKRSERTSGANKVPQQSQVEVSVKGFKPVYMAVDTTHDPLCTICRNELDEACSQCQILEKTDSCPIFTYPCGHEFHLHCLQRFKVPRNCPYPRCNRKFENL